MEDKNCPVSQSPATSRSEPPMSPLLEQAGTDTDVVPNQTTLASGGRSSNTKGNMDTNTNGVTEGEVVVKRKRGRPRKYDIEGSGLSTPSEPTGSMSCPFVKRGRGRPRGSGKLQLLASIGGNVAETAGGNFTPHVVTVYPGEDIVEKILSFSERGPRAICILSATGVISSAILRQPGSSGGILRYEGRFEILSLRGACTYGGFGSSHRKACLMSISLAKPDGRVFGGAVEGSLIAAAPIQLVVGSFKQSISKELKKKYRSAQSHSAPSMPDKSDMINARVPPQLVPRTSGSETCASATAKLLQPIQGGAENYVAPADPNNIPSASLHGLAPQIPLPLQTIPEKIMPPPGINTSVPQL